jgi:hypothetical protein
MDYPCQALIVASSCRDFEVALAILHSTLQVDLRRLSRARYDPAENTSTASHLQMDSDEHSRATAGSLHQLANAGWQYDIPVNLPPVSPCPPVVSR